MSKVIQLLTVENTANRKKNPTQQQLEFLLCIKNLAYDKQVEIVWVGDDGIWHTLSAAYLANRGENSEYWHARIIIKREVGQRLPGDIRCAARLRCQTGEHWDNNQGSNYLGRLNAGIVLNQSLSLQNLSFFTRLETGVKSVEIKLALNSKVASNPVIHWTINNWQQTHQAACRLKKSAKQTDCQIWSARLKIGDGFRLQYAISAERHQQLYWDNNGGIDYTFSRKPLKILILNLHCYQEAEQDRKFSLIAKAMDELEVDIACFQEAAEPWNEGRGYWQANAANIINQSLKQSFKLFFDWSHLGFDRYREGVAILSRFDLHNPHGNYVSENADIYSIHSRKVVAATISVPHIGSINVFSVHLSWWEDGFQLQFQQLSNWAKSLVTAETKATLLCGDFNITCGSDGYKLVVNNHEYEDQYLAANTQGLFAPIYRVGDTHWGEFTSEDYRIDYIYMHKNSKLRVSSAKTLFTASDYGQVSDHCGYLMTFEPK